MKITELLAVNESKMKDLAYAISQGAPNPLLKKTVQKPITKHEALLRSFAEKSGKSTDQVRAVWNHHRQRLGTNWPQVTAATKRELGIL